MTDTESFHDFVARIDGYTRIPAEFETDTYMVMRVGDDHLIFIRNGDSYDMINTAPTYQDGSSCSVWRRRNGMLYEVHPSNYENVAKDEQS